MAKIFSFTSPKIKMDGYKTLDEGQRVSFEVTTGQNGKLQASDVHKL